MTRCLLNPRVTRYANCDRMFLKIKLNFHIDMQNKWIWRFPDGGRANNVHSNSLMKFSMLVLHALGLNGAILELFNFAGNVSCGIVGQLFWWRVFWEMRKSFAVQPSLVLQTRIILRGFISIFDMFRCRFRITWRYCKPFPGFNFRRKKVSLQEVKQTTELFGVG